MSGRRRYVPPDARRVAARFDVEPASEEAGKRAYLIARALGTANNIAGWEPEHFEQDGWVGGTSGLSERDKFCWRLIAGAAGGPST